MKYAEFIRILENFIYDGGKQGDYVLFVTDLFLNNSSKKNPLKEFDESTLQKIYRGDPRHPISKKNSKILSSDFTDNKFINKISGLDDIAKTKLKEMLEEKGAIIDVDDIGVYCAKLYLDFLVQLSEGKDEISFTDNILPALKERITISEDDEEIMIKAKTFCQNHEEELELLPLAMVAEELDPKHKTIRTMYNEFSRCSELEKRKICELADTELIKFDLKWQTKCLAMFEKDFIDFQLGSNRLLYSISQYLWRSMNYLEETIDDIDPYIFDNLFRSQSALNLLKNRQTCGPILLYIEKYLDDKHEKITPPYDYLWQELNLSSIDSPEKNFCFWLMRFIISSCYALTTENKGNKHVINEYLIKTFEDMYYYTYLRLWYLYGNAQSN